MKILVLTSSAPLWHDGADELCAHLVHHLHEQDIEAEALRIPFTCEPAERLLEEMLIAHSLQLSNVDRVIALTFPSYLIPHTNKVVWLLRQHRQVYDLFEAGRSNVPGTPAGDRIRHAVRRADDLAFVHAKKIYASTKTAASRLRQYNGFDATVLPPPVNDPELFAGADSQGYVVVSGRINAEQRQTLLVRALRYAPKVRLVVAGPPDTAQDRVDLARVVAHEDVADRVRLDIRSLPRREHADLINRSLAVAYVPSDEDSLSTVAMEAFLAGKPVITTSDGGGLAELIDHGQTGYVAAPTTRALGAVLRQVAESKTRAAEMGLAGRQRLAAKNLDWSSTIQRLLA
jgi:glycosyltransferase involved in cell wall biosynthesis